MISAASTPKQSTRYALSEEERIAKDLAAAVVADRLPVQRYRAMRDSGSREGYDREAWTEVAALGWPGVAISKDFGGSGLGIRALAAVIEEAGRSLAPLPLVSTGLVAATVIARFATHGVASRWLPEIAAGRVIAALAVDESAHHICAPLRLQVTTGARGAVLNGTKRYVADGLAANLLLVSASSDEKPVLALARADAPGVTVDPLRTLDGRGLADIQFDDAPIDQLLAEVAGRNPVECALDCARAGLAAEMLGASGRAFEMTLDYMRVRRQFGHPIGSFQALQHRAARLFIELELARSCVGAAADALHRDTEEVPVLVSLAKAATGELMRTVAYECIQLHGGIGMTDAHDAGLFLKRGRVATVLYGDAAFHIDRYAALKGHGSL